MREAEADVRAGLGSHEEGPIDLSFAVGGLLFVLTERGELDAAEAVLAEHGLAEARDVEFTFGTVLLNARGRLRVAQGRPREAIADLEACGEMLHSAGLVCPAYLEWRSDLALADLSVGEQEAARRIAAEELALAREWEGPREIGISLRTSGLVEGGERGIELLAESVSVLDRSEAKRDLAHALVEHGAALRRAGRRRDAREPLRRGLDLASRCGSLALAERAREELVAAGARPRRAVLSGPESLTASELRVARLAAEGHSNREIAQALFVTRRTVEVHLTSAYRKLEIDSREALAAALERPVAG